MKPVRDAYEPPEPLTAATIHAVSEVRAPVADHLVTETVSFFRELFALEPWPRRIQPPGSLALGPQRRGLVFTLAHHPQPDPARRKIVLVVTSLDGLVKRLTEREWPFDRARGIFGSDDAVRLADPTGNLIEVRQFRSL